MEATRTVVLWNLEGIAAIILEPSNVKYSNQTCGHACIQSSAEGILIPFNDDTPLHAPERALWRRMSALLENVQQLTPDLADQVDGLLAMDAMTRCATVDRDRLTDSHESWVYIDLDTEASGLLTGFQKAKAVLTWQNSD
ncbi:MAG: hypothetical protein OHK0012_12600 [Synechococcales cyanobacterium]